MDNNKTYRSYNDKKIITNRLNRIDGQISGVKKMVEDDRHCDEILIQLQAIDKAVKSLANLVLEKHMYDCVTTEFENGNLEVIDEVVSLFRRFQ